MKKTIGLGNALVDVLTVLKSDDLLSELSLPKGSMQLIDKELSAKIQNGIMDGERFFVTGGSASNTISGMAKLGASCGFIGKTGEDEVGRFFYDDMKNHGVQPLLVHSQLPSGVCVSLVSPDGERTMATYLGAACELSAEELSEDQFEGYDFCHIEGYLVQNWALIEQAMRLAKSAGLKVSLDLASYNVVEENYDFLHRIVKEYVDIVFANEEEAKAFTGVSPEESVNIIAEMCEIAVVKLGKKGSLIKSGSELEKVGILQNVNSIDTTGAGDLFAAGFLYGLSNDYPLEICGKIGAITGGNIVQVVGSKMNDSQWDNIRKEIKKLL